MKKIYEQIWGLARKYLKDEYNYLHTKVVIQYAKKLLKAEEGDESIIIPAIILHDTGWSQVPKDIWKKSFGKERDKSLWTLHEKLSVKIAESILSKVDHPKEKIIKICTIIKGHDTKEPKDLNGKIVRDADKLWRYSKMGFYHQPDMSKRKINKQKLEWAEGNIEKWFYTNTAKQIARKELKLRKLEGS